MKRFSIVLLSVLAAVTLGTGVEAAIDLPHDVANNVDCLSCHAVHNYLGDALTKEANVTDLCQSCHYYSGNATPADTHQSVDCTVCHEPHLQEQNNAHGTNYGMLIRTQVETPNSGTQTVKFTGPTGLNSFADGDATYDGICEVCHTTTIYHTNDGGDPAHYDGEKCTGCHTHVDSNNGFGSPTGGGAHQTHVGENYGPGQACADCHGAFTPPQLADGQTLATTTLCNNCHSADGVATAKAYWNTMGSSTGEPGSWLAVEGERSFCGSCHDDTPGNTKDDGSGVFALNVLGNDTTYGQYVRGHGKSSGNYAMLPFQASGATGNPAANKSCNNCHDYISQHFGATDYRLKAGFEDDANNTNCKQCHNPGTVAIAAPEDYTTYQHYANQPFVHGGYKCRECHDNHGATGSFAGMTKAASPARCTVCHDGATATSASTHQSLDCGSCHNPHTQEQNEYNGSIYGKLIRRTIETLSSGAKAVVFTGVSGTNSFADGDATYDGVCEVCHTTTNYHRNDGSGAAHNTGVNCTDCHTHDNGFTETPGSGGSHSTHLYASYGPQLSCSGCHGAQTPPLLSDGLPKATTGVCDNCHSADGVADAKNYWSNPGSSEGTAGSWLVALGSKSYCGSCHDSSPGVVSAQNAQNVLGNDSGYGFYQTGHGRRCLRPADTPLGVSPNLWRFCARL